MYINVGNRTKYLCQAYKIFSVCGMPGAGGQKE